MEIKRMERGTLAEVAALERACFSQPWSERVLETELGNANAIFYTARESGALAGYIGMHRVLDEGYIANIAVADPFRRRGVATALLGALIGYAHGEKLGFVTLEVREGNAPATSFYQKMGFGEVGRRRDFYANPTEDAVLMTLFLARESGRASE